MYSPDKGGHKELEEKRLVLLIFLLAIIVRLMYALSNPTLPTIIDAADFDIIGYNISIGNGFGYGPGDHTSWRAPGYPFFLAAVYYLFGHIYWPIWFFECLFAGFVPVLIYYTGKIAFSPATGILSAIISIFHPKLISSVNLGLAENLFTVFTAALILTILLFHRKPGFFISVLTGIVAGCTLYIKAIYLPYLLIILPISFLLNKSARNLLKWYSVTVITILLILVPWIVRNYQVHGQFVLMNTNGGFTLWYNNNSLSESGYFWGATARDGRQEKIDRMIEQREKQIDSPESLVRIMTPVVRSHYWKVIENVGNEELRQEFRALKEAEADDLFFRKAFDHIRQHKMRFLKKSVRSALKFFHVYDEGAQYQWLWGFIFPFSILGFLLNLKNWRDYLPFFGLFLNIWAISTLFEASVRYRIPVEPYFILFGLSGITELCKKKLKPCIMILIVVLLINIFGIVYPEETRQFIRNIIQRLGFRVIPW